jgi:copper ion binding protein
VPLYIGERRNKKTIMAEIETTTQRPTKEQKHLDLQVEGMTCASCVNHVQKALSRVEGVDNVNVNLATEKASLWFDPSVTTSELIRTVRETGYDVTTDSIDLAIGGMTCAACVAHVEKALGKVPGVIDVNVNLATEKATVNYLPGATGLGEFQAAVAQAGYEVLGRADTDAQPVERARDLDDESERKMAQARQRMLIAWAFTAIIIIWMIPDMFFGIHWPNHDGDARGHDCSGTAGALLGGQADLQQWVPCRATRLCQYGHLDHARDGRLVSHRSGFLLRPRGELRRRLRYDHGIPLDGTVYRGICQGTGIPGDSKALGVGRQDSSRRARWR